MRLAVCAWSVPFYCSRAQGFSIYKGRKFFRLRRAFASGGACGGLSHEPSKSQFTHFHSRLTLTGAGKLLTTSGTARPR